MENLYSASGFSAEPLTDTVFCQANNIPVGQCADDQVDTFTGGNPNLKPELSESLNLGFAWGNARMNVSADYWNIEIIEALTIPTAQGLVSLEQRGVALPIGASITRDGTGAITTCLPGQTSGCGIAIPWLNLAMQDYTGLDVRFDYNLPLSGSDINFRVIHSHILEANEQTTPADIVEDVAGKQDSPEFRTVFVTDWSRGDHTVAAIVNHTDGYVNTSDTKINSMTTVDVQYTWDVTANGRLVLGVLNIADEDPPLDPNNDTSQPFNSEIYGMDGRVPYVQYRHNF
jgi:iron complex outermembrane receptor protein